MAREIKLGKKKKKKNSTVKKSFTRVETDALNIFSYKSVLRMMKK